MSFSTRNCFFVLICLIFRRTSVSRITLMGICLAYLRKGIYPDSTIKKILVTEMGTSSTGFSFRIICSGTIRESRPTAQILTAMDKGATISARITLSLPKIRRIWRFVAPTTRRSPISSLRLVSTLSIALEIPTPQLTMSAMPRSTPMIRGNITPWSS